MEDIWVIELEDPDTYYNKFYAKQLPEQFSDKCDGLNNTYAVNIRLAMPTWWDEATGVPDYILWMEKRQKKSSCINCPIERKHLAAVSKLSLRATLAFPTNRYDWYKLPQSKHTWRAWKNNSSLLTPQQIFPTEQTNNVVSTSAAQTLTVPSTAHLPTMQPPMPPTYYRN